MSEQEHIVIVDDEEDVRNTLSEYLGDHGFRITALKDAIGLRNLVEVGETFDIAILDITMPGEDGLSLARHLRASTSAGIVMVTASGETVDRIIGIEMGADDYLAKPVDPRELLARIKSVLRRLKEARGSCAPKDTAHEFIAFGHCRLDLDAQELFDDDGSRIPISSLEFQLLKVFAERPNRVLSREQLLELAHDRNSDPFDRSIDIRIARLRRKVELDPGKPSLIRTVRGSGYRFTP